MQPSEGMGKKKDGKPYIIMFWNIISRAYPITTTTATRVRERKREKLREYERIGACEMECVCWEREKPTGEHNESRKKE